jgi:hypothetical protein
MGLYILTDINHACYWWKTPKQVVREVFQEALEEVVQEAQALSQVNGLESTHSSQL